MNFSKRGQIYSDLFLIVFSLLPLIISSPIDESTFNNDLSKKMNNLRRSLMAPMSQMGMQAIGPVQKFIAKDNAKLGTNTAVTANMNMAVGQLGASSNGGVKFPN
ncbi:expressed protein [Phakopsora pachyrhizi]|uniref:Expressed protein n=1 Tax=Phakopsora pachyrhizi TaxID=170000 RepID=A0AAV0ANK0_PHAPC|nr:expressed protein [Phakopsora pachyrhizi]